MKTKRILAILLAMAMLIGVFAACSGGGSTSGSSSAGGQTSTSGGESGSGEEAGGETEAASYFNAEGLPIVNEPVTLRIMINKNVSDLSGSYEEKEAVKRAEEETGLSFEWIEISAAAWAEQVGVTMAGGDMPDIVQGSIPNFGSYLDSFTMLDDLIDQYAPNVKAFFEERPDLYAAGTMEDGHHYSLPTYQGTGDFSRSNRYGINKVWLDNVGMEIPTTQDELFDVLMAFKEQDANGNGDASDEIPFSFEVATASAIDMDSYGLNFLLNCCGVHSTNYVQIDDGVVSFAPTSDAYRDFLEYGNKLYTNGLLDMDGFVQQTADFLAKGAAGRLGIIGHHSYLDIVSSAANADQYVPMLPTKDKNGEITVTGRALDGDWFYDAFKVSVTSQYPEAAVRLYDYFQSSEELLDLWAWGPEGVVYDVNEDGVKVKRTEFEEGITNFAQARQTYSSGMSGFWMYPFELWNTWEKQPRDLLMDEFEEMYKPYLCEAMPSGIDMQEVVERRNDQFTEINTYIQNFTAQSIMTGLDDAKWQAHLDSCEKLNVAQYTEDYQNFYDRMKALQ